MTHPRLPAVLATVAAVFGTAAAVTFALSVAAPGAGPPAAYTHTGGAYTHTRPLADTRAGWAPRQARLTAADVTHAQVMARAAREVARARREAALAAQQQAAAQAPPAPAQPAVAAPAAPSGNEVLSAAQIGQLWLNAGGSASTESVAVCVAEAESGGRADAISPTQDYGIWQEHDAPQALNPAVSASMAIAMSSDGTDWSQWTTAASCGV